MKLTRLLLPGLLLVLLPDAVSAGDTTRDAAIGGGAGGAIGGAIGAEVGGRDGAIIGSAVGAALGTAVATDDDKDSGEHHRVDDHVHVDVGVGAPPSRFCPPGQAKKGNC